MKLQDLEFFDGSIESVSNERTTTKIRFLDFEGTPFEIDLYDSRVLVCPAATPFYTIRGAIERDKGIQRMTLQDDEGVCFKAEFGDSRVHQIG